MQSLRLRILDADPHLRVKDIVREEVLAKLTALAPQLTRAFAHLRIVWGSDRACGQSPDINSGYIELGHRRGDHLATRPHAFGISPGWAEYLLALQLEGTIVHELGHVALIETGELRWKKQIKKVLTEEGPVSTYLGHTENTPPGDVWHEAFAEWCNWYARDESFASDFPLAARLVEAVLASVG